MKIKNTINIKPILLKMLGKLKIISIWEKGFFRGCFKLAAIFLYAKLTHFHYSSRSVKNNHIPCLKIERFGERF